MKDRKNEIKCPRTNCTANMLGVCKALDKTAKVGGYTHTIDEEYIATCPFFKEKAAKVKEDKIFRAFK